jgi:NADH-quinone oxidoreductase subunit K
MDVPVTYYVVLSGIVFSIGLVGVLIRRNIIIILLSVELMLNATNINFVAFSVAVGLAIIIALYRHSASINIDDFRLLKW